MGFSVFFLAISGFCAKELPFFGFLFIAVSGCQPSPIGIHKYYDEISLVYSV